MFACSIPSLDGGQPYGLSDNVLSGFCRILVMANGERLLVPHEDFIWIMPNRRVVQVTLPKGASRWVNLQLLAGFEKPHPETKAGRSKRNC